jgi:predicted RNA-binding protein with PIN domain
MSRTSLRTLPDDVQAALVRGIGAFVRDAELRVIPPGIRRFRGWRPQALHQHRRALLDSLENDDFREAMLEWLDDRPPLSQRDAATLRIAGERGEGWAERLAGRAATGDRTTVPPGGARADEIARYRQQVKEARADLRRAREEARRASDDRERRLTAVERERDELELRASEYRATADELRGELDAARAEAARDNRRYRRQEQRARADADELRDEVKKLRRALAQAERQLQDLSARPPRADPSPPKPAAAPRPERAVPGRSRQPLAVPPGRLPEDPETLDEWLVPDVWLLVDGYNVTKAEGGFGNLSLASQRDRLVEEVRRLATRKRLRATVVFDGSQVPPGTRRLERGPVAVEYSSPDEVADDHLIAMLEAAPTAPAVLVTNDRDLQERAGALGATIATSQQLLALIR